MEQVAPNAPERVFFASLERRTEEMEDRHLLVFVRKKVEKMKILRAWTAALYSSQWEQMIQQKFYFQSSVLRLETLLDPPDNIYHLAKTTQPKLAPLNPVSAQHKPQTLLKPFFFCFFFPHR